MAEDRPVDDDSRRFAASNGVIGPEFAGEVASSEDIQDIEREVGSHSVEPVSLNASIVCRVPSRPGAPQGFNFLYVIII